MFYGCPEKFVCKNAMCLDIIETLMYDVYGAESMLYDMRIDAVLGCDENGIPVTVDSIMKMETYINARRAVIDAFESYDD